MFLVKKSHGEASPAPRNFGNRSSGDAVHGVWANLDPQGMPLFLDGVGILARGFSLGTMMNRAKKVRDRKWTELHWKVGLASVVVATAHGAWFALRILGR